MEQYSPQQFFGLVFIWCFVGGVGIIMLYGIVDGIILELYREWRRLFPKQPRKRNYFQKVLKFFLKKSKRL